jgi:hypothetical protein
MQTICILNLDFLSAKQERFQSGNAELKILFSPAHRHQEEMAEECK